MGPCMANYTLVLQMLPLVLKNSPFPKIIAIFLKNYRN